MLGIFTAGSGLSGASGRWKKSEESRKSFHFYLAKLRPNTSVILRTDSRVSCNLQALEHFNTVSSLSGVGTYSQSRDLLTNIH